jgi:hypothetical protein
MQWAVTPDISETSPLSETDKQCFKEIRDVLSKFGCLDRFGINLIHKHFEIAEDEALLETIDVEGRTLTVRPVKKTELQNSVETQWLLRNGESYIACPVWCSPGGGHCPRHHQRANA